MNTRRAFLAEVGVALSGLVLPGISQACGRRRRRCRPACECAEARGPEMVKTAAGCESGCPYSLIGQLDGMYTYRCRCYPSCGTFINVTDSQWFSPLPRPCDGTSANCIPLPSTAERMLLFPDYSPSKDALKGVDNYITLKDVFKVPKGSGIIATPHGSAQYPDGAQTRHVRLYVVRYQVGLPPLRIGMELEKGTTDPAMHDKKAELVRPIDHYHQVRSGGQVFHVLLKK